MDPSNEKLLDLLRLTDKSLARFDPATLQQLIANDVQLRATAERLDLVLHAAQSIGKESLWHELDLSDAEHIAAILDGGSALEMPTSADLVRHVDELDRLVVGASSLCDGAASDLAAQFLRAAVDRELASGDEPRKSLPVFDGESIQLRTVDRVDQRLRRPAASERYAWPIAISMIVVIVVLLVSRASQQRAPRPNPPLPEPQELAIDPPSPPGNQPDTLPKQPPPETPEPPQMALEVPPVVEPTRPVVEVPDTRPRPRVPEVQQPVLPQRLKWERISGLVATQVPGSDAWYAMKADGYSSTGSDGRPQLYRTLGNSWGEARTESGIRVVLGPHAVVRVAVRVGASPRVSLEIENGKVSLGALPAATEVTVKHAVDQSEWLVSSDDTELAFDVEESVSDLQLVQGGIRFSGQSFTGPANVSFDGGRWVSGRLARRAPWIARPPALNPIERQLAIIAEEEGDLVDGLLAHRPGMNALQAHAAAIWGLSLDPARTVPLALASTSAAQRAAAAQWLADPANELVTLRPVLARIQPLLAGSPCNVVRWIAVARGEMPLSRSLAQNMLLGLRPTEPLFVREMALASLMNMTGQAFPMYDIQNPTRQGIAQVTRAVQPWINQLQ